MKRRRFLMIAAALAMSRPGRAEVTRWHAEALGGTVQIDLRGPRPLAQETIRAIGDVIEEVEAAASLFRASSALSRLNAEGQFLDPPRALVDLLHLSNRMFAMTGGRFDPTVQSLWRALAEGKDPAPASLTIGWDRVVAGNPVRLGSGQTLTFNGIAQGYAADRVCEVLRQAGYGPALVDMGEFAALGGPFRLGVEDPSFGSVQTQGLTDAAIATSSPAIMRLGDGFHILGPHGEKPVWSTVAVVAQSAGLADGLSTALCLLDEGEIRALKGHESEIESVTAVTFGGDVTTF